jgi:enolase
MALISSIFARWILDSRGLPTVSCQITIDQNGRKAVGKASVPSGASTGSYEALELRDGQMDFGGKGVNLAVENINSKIGGSILNREFADAKSLDEFVLSLDASHNKSELGANAILAVSMAAHRAFASLNNLELFQYLRRLYFSALPVTNKFPRLMCNVVNGGAHADSGLAIQEFMIVPNSGEIEKDVQMASEIYHILKKNLKKDGHSISLGDEGGFAPHIATSVEVLDYLQKAITDAGFDNISCSLAMDCAASEFYNKNSNFYTVDGKEFTQASLTDFYADLESKYPIISIEDAFGEDDVLGWQIITKKLGSKMHLIGDDLFVTNPERFQKVGLNNQIANGVLIKLNQIGSVLETCQMINDAKANNYITAVSHRSGETCDDFMSDLAFASQSEFIKLGAPARGERVAKYNRLVEISDLLS